LRRQNYRGVPIREIAELLVQRLRNTIDAGGCIRLNVSGGTPVLDERQGFALALALNELITNALHHGFHDGRAGCLSISILEENATIRIDVADDGVGDKSQENGTPAVGSGRSIVEALVRA